MEFSPSIDQVALAASKMQFTASSPQKTAKNAHLGNAYAPLPECWKAIKEALHANELVLFQSVERVDGGFFDLVSLLVHSSGQWIKSRVPLIIEDMKGLKVMQELGVAITYAKRYGLEAILGLCAEDDTDGETPRTNKPANASTTKSAPPDQTPGGLSTGKIKRFWAIRKSASFLSDKDVAAIMKSHGCPVKDTFNDMVQNMPWKSYDKICEELENEAKAQNETA